MFVTDEDNVKEGIEQDIILSLNLFNPLLVSTDFFHTA